MNVGPGDSILVKIGNRRIRTTIDENNVQRLPEDPVYRALLDSGALSLNDLAISRELNKISFEDYLEFYLHIGYSVSGFAGLSRFEHLEIDNPLWREEQ